MSVKFSDKKVYYFFKVNPVSFIERRKLITVDIQYSFYFSIHYDRNDNFRTGKRTTGDMSWELIYIGYNLCTGFRPCRAAYSTSFFNTITCYTALKRPQMKFTVMYQIETYPEKAESFL